MRCFLLQSFFIASFIYLLPSTIVKAQTTCAMPSTSLTEPLPDRTSFYTYYLDMENSSSDSIMLDPGLYPNSKNQAPLSVINQGQNFANQITPLNSSGQPDPNGKIGLISVGMSNTSMVFGPFRNLANALPAKNPSLTIVNTALSSMVADDWNEPTDYPWTTLDQRLGSLSKNQVQIIWIKITMMGPQNYPDHISYLTDRLYEIVTTAKTQLPQLKLVFLSNRTRSYDINTLGIHQHGLNSEPYAFENAFAIKRFVSTFSYPDTFITWGPYLWIDGENPRSDTLTWPASDLNSDCTHPSTSGSQKAGQQIFNHFLTNPISTNWFLNPSLESTTFIINPSQTTIPSGQTITFQNTAPSNATVYWFFDDGLTSTETQPSKKFSLPGTYQITSVAIEPSGIYHRGQTQITVSPSDPPPSSIDFLALFQIIRSFLNPYSIFDFNTLVSNL